MQPAMYLIQGWARTLIPSEPRTADRYSQPALLTGTFYHMGTENAVTMEKGGVRWSCLSPSSSLYVASHSLRYESTDSLL